MLLELQETCGMIFVELLIQIVGRVVYGGPLIEQRRESIALLIHAIATTHERPEGFTAFSI